MAKLTPPVILSIGNNNCWESMLGLGDSLAGEKCLPYKHKDLSSAHRTHIKKLGVVVSPVTPALGRWRQAGPWGSLAIQSSWPGKFQLNGIFCLKELKKEQCPRLSFDL